MRLQTTFILLLMICLAPLSALARDNDCKDLPSYAQLKEALDEAVAAETSGLNFHMWATLVNRDGVVCAIAFSRTDRGAQWPGSRVISAQKANTANAFGLETSSDSAGPGPARALHREPVSAVQPAAACSACRRAIRCDTAAPTEGPSATSAGNDPIVGERVGGVNVFGGGLWALAAPEDRRRRRRQRRYVVRRSQHRVALRTPCISITCGVVPGGASLFAGDPTHPDNIIFDIAPNPFGGTGISAGGFGHPTCLNAGGAATLPGVR